MSQLDGKLDYRQFYDLESYLFGIVGERFHRQGYLEAFDFFCIVIWKANRAKSRIAKKVLAHGDANLDVAVRKLTRGIARGPDPKDRLRYLIEEWHFRLPMASAVLTALYPDEFTVYDVRVCDLLGEFGNLMNLTGFDAMWRGYEKFQQKVIEATPQRLSLRDKDRFLWGESFHRQLQDDVKRCFGIDRGEFS